MKVPSITYSISIPIVDTDTVNFSFNTKVPEGTFYLQMKWNKFKNAWTGYATIPDGSIRQFGIWPNVTSWSSFLDYGVRIDTTLASIGLNDISNVKLMLLIW
jgi:hypothetical protein